MTLQIKDSTGKLYDIPGDHFMCRSGSFMDEKVVYEVGSVINSGDIEWLELFSREDDLYAIADYIKFYVRVVGDTRKTFHYPVPGLIDSVIPSSIYALLLKLRSLKRPKKWVRELAMCCYSKDSFPNLSELWKNRYLEDFCATREYLEFIKNHKK